MTSPVHSPISLSHPRHTNALKCPNGPTPSRIVPDSDPAAATRPMSPAAETLPVAVPVDLLSELTHLGDGDPIAGIRITLAATKELTATPVDHPLDPDAIVLRFLRLSDTLAERAAHLERHIERYELDRRAFLDDVARIGRINEEGPS